MVREFGLIGKVIGHSYSARYFNEKFEREHIDAHYDLFPLPEISDFPELVAAHPLLAGLNVTIPYKVEVIPYLDALSEEAKGIGAVNVIKFVRNAGVLSLVGYNSDAYGFSESLRAVIDASGLHLPTPGEANAALVLGTGGASRAVTWSLRRLGYRPQLVGRTRREDCLAYSDLTETMVAGAAVVVNTTPLGMHPDVDSAAPFPYQWLHPGQICFDIVYNPADTLFMRLCRRQGCIVSNGLEMLRLQAVGAWRIWNE